MINPSIKDYIKDLSFDNNCMFAQNHQLKELVKQTEKELHKLLTGEVTDTRNKRIYTVICNIQRYYGIIRFNLKCIAKNLEKIRGLENGTIKEI